MPKITEFNGMKIYVYFDDHDPPHFHVRGQDKAEIYINTGEYKNGLLPLKKRRDILIWLNKYRNDIMETWIDCQEYRKPRKIPPL